MNSAAPIDATPKRLGVIIGGSGLIGGALIHYLKKHESTVDILAPNSKRLSLRVADDIKLYFQQFKPDFIINTAIASLDSDPKLSFEINCLGAINLARVAQALHIPYIYISSAAVMPTGEDLTEDQLLPLRDSLPNYAKSKLMTEMTLHRMHREQGLNYTIIRLGVVYGKHDHKIKGFQRMLFSIADQSMPVMLTVPGVMHSYTETRKLPPFILHILNHRQEFSGETYHFVDRSPVALSELILTIKSYLELKRPREIYVPYRLANIGKAMIIHLLRGLGRVGVDARLPAELMFLENFYSTQTLSTAKLERTSYGNPDGDTTVFTALPGMIEYYLTRWEELNLVSSFNQEFYDPHRLANDFLRQPDVLLKAMRHNDHHLFIDFPGQ